ncbi:ATP synthase subunit I [Pseudodesulfovibrio sp.]|uniref:ATP synthase subunit I n=1 Tax=Pseudodesulfovibrio sp. TaxID=2035812 RepID=UPI002620C327|nr:ATP synthase subunit I [Pseudodesulfovibrio sp.]MDD3312301.1 ATP synthase subunit I [Pseudodesulfovibrio sp.]
METINRPVERLLAKSGFVHPEVRLIIRNQIYVSLGASLAIVLVTLFSQWSLAFAAGALLALINFWAMARIVQSLIYVRKGAPFLLFAIFMGKMTLSGLALYWLIGVHRVPIWGLVAGLGTVVANIAVTGLVQMGHKKA